MRSESAIEEKFVSESERAREWKKGGRRNSTRTKERKERGKNIQFGIDSNHTLYILISRE
jgi:hypothetical protein